MGYDLVEIPHRQVLSVFQGDLQLVPPIPARRLLTPPMGTHQVTMSRLDNVRDVAVADPYQMHENN